MLSKITVTRHSILVSLDLNKINNIFHCLKKEYRNNSPFKS